VTGQWPSVPLRAIYRRVEERDRADLPPLSVYRDLGVVPREGRDDNNNKLSDDLSAYKVVRPGDLVLNKMKTWQGSIGVSDYEGIVSPAYFIGRRVADVYSRFMHHLLRSAPLIAEYGARSKGIRPSQWDLPWEEFVAIRVNVPPLATQRAIADFLDSETDRIDALIEKKRQMVKLLEEQFRTFAEQIIWSDVIRRGPLMHRTDPARPIMYGIVLPGPDVPQGVPIVKGGDVAARRLSPNELNRTTPEIEAPYARARLAPEDLVFAIRGGIGDVELVPHDLAGANITQDVARISTAPGVSSAWLRHVLRTSTVRRDVSSRVTGATIKGLNIWDLKRVLVPMSDETRQNKDLRTLRAAEVKRESLTRALKTQTGIVAERRQALITAAVTGELDIPGAAA
jgi:type I restriction enzyme S subunit